MADPMTTAVATIVVTKAMNGLTEAGRTAVEALVRLVRRRLSAREASREILVRAESEPTDEANRIALVEALRSSIVEDPAFAEELDVRWRAAVQGGALNRIEGEVYGNVVQARDIHGGISFG